MKDGKIDLDSVAGKELGFTSDRFQEASWLWKMGNTIWISFIFAKKQRKGYFSNLLKKCWEKGFMVKVPTPSKQMLIICLKKGFTYQKIFEKDIMEEVDVLVGKPSLNSLPVLKDGVSLEAL